jgi:hypothetical protein
MLPDENGNEDLMKEAVSLIKRIEFRSPKQQDLVVLGFNNIGWLFVYRGSDPMYRFDEQGRLRRAFVNGLLYRTEGQTLAMMERRSSRTSSGYDPQSESILLRRDLQTDELDRFRTRMRSELEEVIIGLCEGEITRQHPVDAVGLVPQFLAALDRVLNSKDFLAPAIVRR